VKALQPVWLVRFFSGVMIFLGIVMFGYNIMATVVGRKSYVQ
jgi:cbb3-type cytochrome oxidase subunit 1